MISTIAATQVYKGVSPVIRKNMTHLFIYRLRNYGDLEAIVEEMSAIYNKKHCCKYTMKQLTNHIHSLK